MASKQISVPREPLCIGVKSTHKSCDEILNEEFRSCSKRQKALSSVTRDLSVAMGKQEEEEEEATV